MSKLINNIRELASHFGTSVSGLDATLSNRAGTTVTIAQFPTGFRFDVEVEGTNATFSCHVKYPFETQPVEVFIDTVGHNVEASDPFDDPIDMLMNLTNPGEQWTLEDAGHILGEAEAQGWRFAPDVDAQYILDLYNDMEGDE